MARPKKLREKPKGQEEINIAKYWQDLFDESLGVDLTEWRDIPQLKMDGNSGFPCPFCTKDRLLFLQGQLIPASAYGLWCKSCELSVKIEHIYYWPILKNYIKKEIRELDVQSTTGRFEEEELRGDLEGSESEEPSDEESDAL